MAAANRHQPKRADCSESQFSLMEFMRDYPDDASCLEHLWRETYSPDGEHASCPKCACERVFRKYATAQGRQSWTCTGCGHHVIGIACTCVAVWRATRRSIWVRQVGRVNRRLAIRRRPKAGGLTFCTSAVV